jgi:hypothetical protein
MDQFELDIKNAERELAEWKKFDFNQLNEENIVYSNIITILRGLASKYPKDQIKYFKMNEQYVKQIQINLKIITDAPLMIKRYTMKIASLKQHLRIAN